MPLLSPAVVHTGKDGMFVDDTARAAIDALFESAEIKRAKRLVLYFHGGLDDAATGQQIAANLDPVFKNADALPIFFVWESGLFEIIPRHLREIAGEDFFKALLKLTLRFTLAKLGEDTGGKSADGSLNLPPEIPIHRELAKRASGLEPFKDHGIRSSVEDLSPEEEQQFQLTAETDSDLSDAVYNLAASSIADPSYKNTRHATSTDEQSHSTLMTPEVIDELRGDVRKTQGEGKRSAVAATFFVGKGLKVFARVIKRFQKGIAHGIYPTIVEEILREFYLANVGVAVWSAMKNETLRTFEESDKPRGGRYLISKIIELSRAGRLPEITLVGHSTGAVFIGNLLAHTQVLREGGSLPDGFAFKRILLLAPACTFRDFRRYVEPPFFGSSIGLYDDIRIFGMADETECHDHMISQVYPRSLLYFVAGLLEPAADGTSMADVPVVGMQRYYTTDAYSFDPDVAAFRAFVGAEKGRVVWSPFEGEAGLQSMALHHGDFDDDPHTRASISFVIKGAV